MSLAPQRIQAKGAHSSAPSLAISIDRQHLAALGLTPRECEVMHWISEGKRDSEIATILGLSPRTVEKHVCHIFEKLKVETRTAAANECRYSLALSQARCGEVARSAPAPRQHIPLDRNP